MKDCCDNKLEELGPDSRLIASQERTLKIVLAINLLMFFVEITWGFLSNSTALMADSLDMFGDALIYFMSLFVVHRGIRAKARVSLLKGLIMLGLSLLILGEAIWKLIQNQIPQAEVMSIVGAIALIANVLCLVLLFKHRKDDLNMQSTWICSRNDIIANVGVIFAGIMVYVFHSNMPDVVVGFLIAAIVIKSSVGVIRRAFERL